MVLYLHFSFMENSKALNLTDFVAEISQEKSSMIDQLDVPNAQRNVRSPHRPSIVSQELPDTVANFVDFVKEGHSRHRYRYNMHTRYRGTPLVVEKLHQAQEHCV